MKWSHIFSLKLLKRWPYSLLFIKWGYIEQRGDIEQSYLFHGNSLISVYNNHVAICLYFRSATEGLSSLLQKFSKCPHDLWPSSFLPYWQFSNEKNWLIDVVLRQSFDRKLISPNVFRDVQKPLFDLCISKFVTILAEEIWISFSNHKISLCSESPDFDGATFNNIGCVYLTEMHVQWSSHFRIWKRETAVG